MLISLKVDEINKLWSFFQSIQHVNWQAIKLVFSVRMWGIHLCPQNHLENQRNVILSKELNVATMHDQLRSIGSSFLHCIVLSLNLLRKINLHDLLM